MNACGCGHEDCDWLHATADERITIPAVPCDRASDDDVADEVLAEYLGEELEAAQ